MLPVAYAYPQGDAGHARPACGGATQLVRTRAEALAHIQNTVSQYNLPPLAKKLHLRRQSRRGRRAVRRRERAADGRVDLALIGHVDEQLQSLELYLVRHAKVDDPQAYHLLQTIPGVGKILALVLLYEMHDAGRFGDQRHFVSYCRLVRPSARERPARSRPARGTRSATPTCGGPSARRPA